jgi:hypothetical protein
VLETAVDRIALVLSSSWLLKITTEHWHSL